MPQLAELASLGLPLAPGGEDPLLRLLVQPHLQSEGPMQGGTFVLAFETLG